MATSARTETATRPPSPRNFVSGWMPTRTRLSSVAHAVNPPPTARTPAMRLTACGFRDRSAPTARRHSPTGTTNRAWDR